MRLPWALYHDDLSIRCIVSDAGLTAHQIALSGSVANLWFAVVDEAQKSGKSGALVALAFEKDPNRDDLKALHAATKVPPTPLPEVPSTTSAISARHWSTSKRHQAGSPKFFPTLRKRREGCKALRPPRADADLHGGGKKLR